MSMQRSRRLSTVVMDYVEAFPFLSFPLLISFEGGEAWLGNL